jgi:arginyl-tRNA synthetase
MSFRNFVSEADSLIALASKSLGYQVPEHLEWEVPSSKGFGDVSFRTGFQLAKSARKSPSDIVSSIASSIEIEFASQKHYVKKVDGHPAGFLNFTFDTKSFFQDVLNSAIRKDYGVLDLGKGSSVLVEHTSVNPNKALHVGHLRNVALGDSVARILNFTNHNVKILNYIDDSGLQVADVIVGIKYLGFPADNPSKKFDHYAGDDIYVQVNKRYETDISLMEKRKYVLKAIEERDPDVFLLASQTTNRILHEQLKTCWRFNATYDLLVFESDIIASKLWEDTFAVLKESQITKLETSGIFKGCWIVVIKGEKEGEEKVLVRSDGTATYVAKDIPFAALKTGLIKDKFSYQKYTVEPNGHQIWRTNATQVGEPVSPVNWGASMSITAIGSEQSKLQRVILRVLEQLSNQDLSGKYIHLGYALMTLSQATVTEITKKKGSDISNEPHSNVRMSGRKGLYVNADDVFDAVKGAALTETMKRNPEIQDSAWFDDVAEKIAISAVRFSLLKQDLDKTITFDLHDSLKLIGETGPYMLYTYARASSILSKVKEFPTSTVASLLGTDTEIDLVTLVSKFDLNVEKASKMLAPKWIAHYAFELCESFNRFYEKNRVIQVEDAYLRNTRIVLVIAFHNVLEQALSLLGIQCPQKI